MVHLQMLLLEDQQVAPSTQSLFWCQMYHFVVAKGLCLVGCCVFWPANAKVLFSQKNTKFQMSNQRLGVDPLLGVTPIRWLTNFFFRFSLWALREPLVCMMKKVIFSWFLNVFNCTQQPVTSDIQGLVIDSHMKKSIIYEMSWASFNCRNYS